MPLLTILEDQPLDRPRLVHLVADEVTSLVHLREEVSEELILAALTQERGHDQQLRRGSRTRSNREFLRVEDHRISKRLRLSEDEKGQNRRKRPSAGRPWS